MMAIELNHASQGQKAVTAAGAHAKNSGKFDDAAAGTSGGFMAMLMSLSVADPVATSLEAEDGSGANTNSVAENFATDGGANFLVQSQSVASALPVPLLIDATRNGMEGGSQKGGHVQWSPSVSVVNVSNEEVPSSVKMTLGAKVASNVESAIGVAKGLVNGSDVLVDDSPAPATATAMALAPANPFESTLPLKAAPTMSLKVEKSMAEALPNIVSNDAFAALKSVDFGGLVKSQDQAKPALSTAIKGATGSETAFGAATGSSNRSDTLLEVPSAKPTTLASEGMGEEVATAKLFETTLPLKAAPTMSLKVEKSMAEAQPNIASNDAFAALKSVSFGEFASSQEHGKPASGMDSKRGAGMDAAFGTATGSISRSDALFVVPPASAVISDSAVAETVSYWVSQGVQTAELTLDGLGESPVEISIRMSGDQAQIDFRTDQTGVREVLEQARSQLEKLLSDQGLALAGMSVGTSGQWGSTGENRQTPNGIHHITMVQKSEVNAEAVKVNHSSVGRTLDLFV